ncbi:hypothetical protein [Hyphomicrobium sp. ghe19]|uniref:hypothetical protein n=1 Tax=Hyphomicrobium sp. ghe19 TaxID=2682968 RepID=UPI00136719B2|nr:hypothetical protein HYPP_02465 [Hyphomicrobium sp. ghe19]
MPLKLKKPMQPEAKTNVQEKHKGTVVSELNDSEKVEVPDEVVSKKATSDPLCEVGVEASYTMNLGDYNSVRVQVSLKVQCQHAEIDQVFDYTKEWTDTKMQTMIEEIEAQKS